jgi:hopene-associated glycosyltransferase HpnB
VLRLIAAVPVAIWCYLAAFRGGYWRMRRQLLPALNEVIPPRKVVAVIPARNEADVIAQSVTSLLQQQLPTPLSLVIVDDASSDGTSSAVHAAAENAVATDRVTVIAGSPLPPGWTGKLWAVQQGLAAAYRLEPDYVLLTDADIWHAPAAIGVLLRYAVSERLSLASLMVRLVTETLAEKLMIPAFVYFFFQLFPPAWVADSQRKIAGAAGGCMLLDVALLRKLGGVKPIAHEVIDDCALARLIKSNGGRVSLRLAGQSHSLRSYGGFSGVERMIARSAFNQLNHSVVLLCLTVTGLAATYVLPYVLLANKRTRYSGAVASGLMLASYIPVVRFYRQNLLSVAMLPFVAMFYGAATIHSAIQYWSGKGGVWKGRVQDSPHPKQTQ